MIRQPELSVQRNPESLSVIRNFAIPGPLCPVVLASVMADCPCDGNAIKRASSSRTPGKAAAGAIVCWPGSAADLVPQIELGPVRGPRRNRGRSACPGIHAGARRLPRDRRWSLSNVERGVFALTIREKAWLRSRRRRMRGVRSVIFCKRGSLAPQPVGDVPPQFGCGKSLQR